MGGGCNESPPPFIGQKTLRMFSFSPTKLEKDYAPGSNSICDMTRTHKGESTEAGHRGGMARSSEEVPVMGMERRERREVDGAFGNEQNTS